MLPRIRLALVALLAVALGAAPLRADLTESLKKGTPDLKSIGPIAFAADGVLFVGDPLGAAVFAIDTGDKSAGQTGDLKIEGIDGKIASLLGIDAKQLAVNSVAVNPASGNVYLGVARGKGPDAMPVLLRADRKGKIDEVALKDVKFAKADLPDVPAADAKGRGGQPARQEAITGLAFVDGKLVVAGISNEDFSSRLRVIPFPFSDTQKGADVTIYHGSHGKFETNAPVRTFVPYEIKGEANLLAAYTCTPLVKIAVKDLKPGEKVKGTTVAELGSGNRPLDMIVYQKDGKDYLLLANSNRGVMKIPTEGVDKVEAITDKVSGTKGLGYDTLKELKGVQHLAKLDKDKAVLLIRTDNGALNLETIALP
jgi:hypothetical protein